MPAGWCAIKKSAHDGGEVRKKCNNGSRARTHARVTPCPLHMTARADLLAVIRAYMANDDPAGLAHDLLLVLELDEDQEDALNDLRTELETAPECGAIFLPWG